MPGSGGELRPSSGGRPFRPYHPNIRVERHDMAITTIEADRGLADQFLKGAMAAGVAVALVGALHLAAWLAGFMAKFGTSTITMKTNAALGLFLAGGALVLLASGKAGAGFWRWVAALAAAIVLALGGLTLVENISGWDLGIDEALATEPAGALGTNSPNRFGPPAAVCLTLVGAALLLPVFGKGRWMGVYQSFATAVCLLGLLGIIGHLYNVRDLYGLAGLTAIAWPTAVCLLVLGGGLLCSQPTKGFMRLAAAKDPGGVALRWLLLPTILVLLALGWLRLLGERHRLYDTAFGTGLLVLSFTVLFCVLLYATASALSRITRSEREARRVLQQQAQLIDLSPAATIVRDMDGTIRFWSEAAVRLYGWTRQEALGRPTHELLQTQFPEPLPQIVEHARQYGVWGGELKQKTKLGEVMAVQSWWLVRFAPDGSAVELLESNLDITARKQTENALKQSEQRYRSFVEASAQVIWRTNERGEVDLPIPSWNEFTGQNESQASGFGWMQVIHPDDRPRVVAAWQAASAARSLYQVEYRLKRHDSQWRHILARGVPVLEGGQVREYIGTCIDVTEQKQAEAAVRKQARLIDLAPAATLVRGLDGRITFWSEGAEKLYGWSRQEALGRVSHELLRTAFLGSTEELLDVIKQNGSWSGELVHETKDGRRVIVNSHWLAQTNAAGELCEVLESNMDITERKKNEEELRQLKDELEVRVKQRTAELAVANKELEAFAYSVSHDLRAPLRHITSYISMLEKGAGPTMDDSNRRYLRIVTDASKRMGHLIDELLGLSRLGRVKMEPTRVDLRRVAEEVIQEMGPSVADRAIEWRIGELPSVQGDSNLLHSALTNLIGNAVKYTRDRNPAVIELGRTRASEEVICFVRDNGAGFDMKFQDKLFGVFQRLHSSEEFEGNGVGLATVRRVIQRHGGRTWAEGEPGKGATFYFSLPLALTQETES